MSKGPLVAVVVFALVFSPPVCGDEGRSRAPASLEDLPPLTDYERQLERAPDGGPAVILFSSGYKRDSWTETRFTTVRRVKILEDAGLDFAEVSFRVRQEEEASGFAGRTILPGGRVLELQPDGVEVGVSYDGIWGPEFVYRFRLPGAEAGAVIEYSYTISTQLGPGFRFNQWFLQDRVMTLQTRFTIDIPVDFMPFSASLENISSSALPQQEEENGRRIVTYSFADVPGLRREPFMPPPESLLARLVVDYRWARSRTSDPHAYWLQFGRDQAKRASDFQRPREGLSELLRRTVPGGLEARERAARICTWIQENIVHLSALPPGEIYCDSELLHLENESVAEVIESGYGSQMEITLLALAMLREAGLEAYLALAVSRESGALRRDFLAPNQFDQAFAAVVLPEEGLLFLHPAAPHCPPLGTPWYVQGALALICTPGGGRFARVPVSRPEDNLREQRIELTVGPGGEAAGIVKTTFRGQENMRLKNLLIRSAPGSRAALALASLGSLLQEVEFGEPVLRNLDSYREPLEIGVSVRLPGFARRQGGGLVFSPGIFAQPLRPDLRGERRTQPIHLPYPFTFRTAAEIALPGGYGVGREGPRTYKSDLGSHRVETKAVPGGVVWEREMVQNRIFFARGEYFALRLFLRRISEADSAIAMAAPRRR